MEAISGVGRASPLCDAEGVKPGDRKMMILAHRSLRRAAGASVALILAATLGMAGCGVAQETALPGSATTAAPATRTAHMTPTAGLPTPGMPDTPGGSAPNVTNVTIATDSYNYRMGETIHVTITNHLRTPVYTSGGKVNCTVVEAQMKTTQGWQMASIAPCGDGNMSGEIVQIAPGATRTVTLATTGAVFDPGTYRLALSYSTYSIPPQLSAPLDGFAGAASFGQGRPLAHAKSSPLETVYSPAFTIA